MCGLSQIRELILILTNFWGTCFQQSVQLHAHLCSLSGTMSREDVTAGRSLSYQQQNRFSSCYANVESMLWICESQVLVETVRDYEVSAVVYLMSPLTLNGLLEVYLRAAMSEISGCSSLCIVKFFSGDVNYIVSEHLSAWHNKEKLGRCVNVFF